MFLWISFGFIAVILLGITSYLEAKRTDSFISHKDLTVKDILIYIGLFIFIMMIVPISLPASIVCVFIEISRTTLIKDRLNYKPFKGEK